MVIQAGCKFGKYTTTFTQYWYLSAQSVLDTEGIRQGDPLTTSGKYKN